MKLRVQFKPELITAFSLAGIVLLALSLFFFTRLDNVVNADLYKYGLQFSNEWAEPYWDFSRLLMIFLGISILVTGFSIPLVLIHVRTEGETSTRIGGVLLVFSLFAICLSVLFFSRLDYIVNHDLYMYGLQFSNEWWTKYETYLDFALSLQGISIAMTVVSAMLVALSASAVEINPMKLVRSSLLTVGAVSLVFSIVYSFQILAFIGLGLAFWGAVLFYVHDEKYAKRAVLDAIAVSSLEAVNQITQKLHYNGITVYLPPKYSKNPEISKACMLKEQNSELLIAKQVLDEKTEIPNGNEALFFIPPGAELTNLFQEALGIRFTKVDLEYIKRNLAKVFEDLEIAKELKIEGGKDSFRVAMKDSIFDDVYKEALKRPEMFRPSGSPLSSAIACILAKVTGKPIVIDRDRISDDGRMIVLEYSSLEKTEKE